MVTGDKGLEKSNMISPNSNGATTNSTVVLAAGSSKSKILIFR